MIQDRSALAFKFKRGSPY